MLSKLAGHNVKLLTALREYLNILLEYINPFQHLEVPGGLGSSLACVSGKYKITAELQTFKFHGIYMYIHYHGASIITIDGCECIVYINPEI